MDPVFENGTDSDTDGITDCEEKYGAILIDPVVQKPYTSVFRSVPLDASNPDQDSDHVLDGLEFRSVRTDPSVLARDLRSQYLREPRIYYSSPLTGQSDDDKIPDWYEHLYNTIPTEKNGALGIYQIWDSNEVVRTQLQIRLTLTFACTGLLPDAL